MGVQTSLLLHHSRTQRTPLILPRLPIAVMSAHPQPQLQLLPSQLQHKLVRKLIFAAVGVSDHLFSARSCVLSSFINYELLNNVAALWFCRLHATLRSFLYLDWLIHRCPFKFVFFCHTPTICNGSFTVQSLSLLELMFEKMKMYFAHILYGRLLRCYFSQRKEHVLWVWSQISKQ